MISCPGCGQNLKFDIASQEMVCSYCDTHYDPYDVEKDEDAKSTKYFEATVFTCPQCGGELYSTENEATAFCIYCGGANILTERISQELRPDYIIPFQKTKEDCKQAYVKKMRKALYVPKAYKSAEFIESFRGIYMPYWSYQLQQDTNISVMGIEKYRSGDYIVTNYNKLHGDLYASADGVSYDASSSFYDDVSQGLGEYDCREQRVFSTSFLSGFYADTADVEYDLYEDEAIDVVAEATMDKIKKESIFRNMEFESDKKFVKESFRTKVLRVDRTMYPVWFMSYRNGDRVAYATVNGQTGQVSADMPVDKGKFLLGTFIVAVPLFLLFNLLLTLNPKECLAVCAFLLIISTILYASELAAIRAKEQFLNDKAQRAFLNKEGEYVNDSYPAPKSNSKAVGALLKQNLGLIVAFVYFALMISANVIGYLIWPITVVVMIIFTGRVIEERSHLECPTSILPAAFGMLVILVAGIIRLVNPVHDAWYYGSAIATLFAVCVNFFACINHYNYLAMRKLPQFDRKGGDDNA